MLSGIEVLCHSSIRLAKNRIIYIDPFKIEENYNDADVIFITHAHYDHFSIEDIKKVKKDDSYIVITEDNLEETKKIGFDENHIKIVSPENKYNVNGLEFETVRSYNIEKEFHPKENNWVGYIIEINDITYYIAGDTDFTPETKSVTCDVAFLPIGGKYTMSAIEAAQLANIIEPQVVIPIHYNSIIGSKDDETIFKNELNENIECAIMIK